MKKLWTAAIGALAIAACTPNAPSEGPGYARSAGSLAISPDSSRLYVADADNNALVVVDAAKHQALKTVAVGKGAAKVVVGADGTIFVANRMDRSVSVIDPASLSEKSRIAVDAEPAALGLTSDGKTLVVGNATGRSVSLVDVASGKETKRIATPGDPSGVKVLDGKAYITYARYPKVSVVDLVSGTLMPQKEMSLGLSADQTGSETRLPGQAVEPVFDPDSGRVYVPHVQSKEDPVPTNVPNNNAYAGSPGTVPVVANAVATVDVKTDQVLPGPALGMGGPVGDCADCGALPPTPGLGGSTVGSNGVPRVLMLANGPLSGPSAAVLDPSGNWLYVTNMNSNNVSVVPVTADAVELPSIKVGHGPNGIAVSGDAKTAYVYNSFDHTISVLTAGKQGITAEAPFVVGTSPLTPEQELGRRLFFAADDTRMTNPQAGGIACASCHPGGREDGRTWKFSEGPRNTPTLAGRNLKDTAPYHWDGSLEDMHAFSFVVENRMGGSGTNGGEALTASDFNAMRAYLETLPAPDNPRKTATLSDAALRGKTLFEGKAACATCHSGPDFTDNGFHDVGTIGTTSDGLPEKFDKGGVNTPPLHNLFFSAPYLHNGTIATLRDRLDNNPGDQHGITSTLSDAEKNDLVAYLEQL